MLSRWVPLHRPRFRPKDTRFKQSLIRTVLVVLLFISLIPLLLIGTLNILRTRDLLGRQVSRQLESIVNHEVEQINQYVDLRDKIIERMVTEQAFHDSLFILLTTEPTEGEYQWATAMIYDSFRTSAQLGIESIFDQMILLRPDGTVLLASDDLWMKKNFGEGKIQHQIVRELIGTNRSIFTYNPVTGYSNQMPLFISRSFVDEQGKQIATLIAISRTDLTYLTLQDSSSFLPEANAYYFAQDMSLIGVTDNHQLIRMPENAGMSTSLKPMIGQQTTQLQFATQFDQKTPIIANAKWLPKYNIGVLLTVSEASIFQVNTLLDPFNLALLFVSLIISGGLVYYGGARLVNPLVKLAHAADSFSRGNWDERVRINRADEIGSLAYSFNHMADELSELYHSLESAVERRTGQLRIASEVAQLATSTTKISDALGRTAELIAERFGFYHVAIYLFDEASQNLVLKEASGLVGKQIRARGDQVILGETTLIGWVASNNQAKIISSVADDPLFRPDELLPDTQSETAIPITIGTEVLGVLDIQSTLINAFDDETVAVFQTFANQISSTLQATRLLESTQISYQETTLLYKAARQVIQAHHETEIIQSIADMFTQLPFIGSVLSVEGENFKILTVTDVKTGRVEKSLQSLNIPTGQMVNLLTKNRVVVIEDISQPSDFDNLLSFLLRRGCKSAALISVLESGYLSKVLVIGSYEMNQITLTSLQPYANLAEVLAPRWKSSAFSTPYKSTWPNCKLWPALARQFPPKRILATCTAFCTNRLSKPLVRTLNLLLQFITNPKTRLNGRTSMKISRLVPSHLRNLVKGSPPF